MTRKQIAEILYTVKDPEIPTLSIVDLGIVTDIQIDKETVEVVLTPTFSGCPALKVMEEMVEQKLSECKEINTVKVRTRFDHQWTSDMISSKGKEDIKKIGLAPPKRSCGTVTWDFIEEVDCPKCGSSNTILKNPFGPTLCRSIHHCDNCLETFEAIKTVQ
ncbi:MAG: 1,2-phenylacetyl-CoA epoxidase subunit PaaD [Bacteroidota bacterium]|nr:1,2-phenylacetyl-CoA epoxidase subunit PaaD [Bacteroidota bacterium]